MSELRGVLRLPVLREVHVVHDPAEWGGFGSAVEGADLRVSPEDRVDLTLLGADGFLFREELRIRIVTLLGDIPKGADFRGLFRVLHGRGCWYLLDQRAAEVSHFHPALSHRCVVVVAHVYSCMRARTHCKIYFREFLAGPSNKSLEPTQAVPRLAGVYWYSSP